jgi:M-phase inducer phosphatase 2
VIDSRYPYEYDAGHIRNAKNIYTKQKLYDEFFFQKYHESLDISKRIIIIFHCEFSSERAPTL